MSNIFLNLLNPVVCQIQTLTHLNTYVQILCGESPLECSQFSWKTDIVQKEHGWLQGATFQDESYMAVAWRGKWRNVILADKCWKCVADRRTALTWTLRLRGQVQSRVAQLQSRFKGKLKLPYIKTIQARSDYRACLIRFRYSDKLNSRSRILDSHCLILESNCKNKQFLIIILIHLYPVLVQNPW